jgi:integrase
MKDPQYRGIYERNGILWLRWTVGGKQKRESLKTTDWNVAAGRAALVRAGRTASTELEWEREMLLYLGEKIGRKLFTETSTTASESVIRLFFWWVNETHGKRIKKCSEITADMVRAFFLRAIDEGFVKKMVPGTKRKEWTVEDGHPCSQGTLVTYQARLSGFWHWLKRGGKVTENVFLELGLDPLDPHLKTRKNFLTKAEIKRLIDNCKDVDLKYVFHMGFNCSMRKDEIISSKPAWFVIDRKNRFIHIPAMQEHHKPVLPTHKWRPKSKRERFVPLKKQVVEFLNREYTHAFRQNYMIERKVNINGAVIKKGFGRRYRWDFRKPFEEEMKRQKISGITPHNMRHSFTSNALKGGVRIADVALYVGDRIRTVETHYAHLIPRGAELDNV